MKTRVVVTGVSAITPVGNDVKSFWQGLKNKTARIGPTTYFDTTDHECKLAAEVKGFNPKQYMGAKAARRMEAFSQSTVTASREAPEQSGIDMEKEDPYRIGVCVGSGIGSLQAVEKDVKKLNEGGPGHVNPLLALLMINNIAAGNIAIQFGLKGKCFSVVTACTTGTRSIGKAFRSIQYGEADMMVANGAEASTAPIGIARLTLLTALNTTEDASGASIPLDEGRNGFVMGEGAGVVVLGSLEHAKARGASILAEVAGYGATCDAFHIISPAEDGGGAARAMENAMKDAGMAAEDIDYVNAHDTSTHHNDLFETEAVKPALGDHTEKVKISSTKSMVSHLLGTTGGVEFITCVKSIQDEFVHAAIGLEKPGEGCDLNYIMSDDVSMDVNMTISNSLRFGGHNISLIVKRFSE